MEFVKATFALMLFTVAMGGAIGFAVVIAAGIVAIAEGIFDRYRNR